VFDFGFRSRISTQRTVTRIVCVCNTPPPLALTVIVNVATLAFDAAFSVSVLVPFPGGAIDAGANVPVTFFGSPLTVRLTADENPLLPRVESVTGVEPPRASTIDVLLKVSVTLGLMTVRVTV
jgi:hypothetical protein